jgi:hypothetical protein
MAAVTPITKPLPTPDVIAVQPAGQRPDGTNRLFTRDWWDWFRAVQVALGGGVSGGSGSGGIGGGGGGAGAVARLLLEVGMSADQPVTGATWTIAHFDTVVTDLENAYDPTAFKYSPLTAGLYLLIAYLTPTHYVNNPAGIQFLLNGGIEQTSTLYFPVDASSCWCVSTLLFLNGLGDYVQIAGFATGSSPALYQVGSRLKVARLAPA